MSYFFLHYCRSHRRVDSTNSGLVLNNGEFHLTVAGVKASLEQPLRRMSGLYPWKFLPLSIATLKVLVVGEGETVGPIISRLGLSDHEIDLLDKKIGRVSWHIGDEGRPVLEHESDWCDDINRLVDWSAGLAKRCPYASTARDLLRLPTMTGPELDQYIASSMS